MLRDLVENNRSYRGFDEGYKFTKAQLEEYIDLTRYTASSVNAQVLKYHIAYKEDEVKAIQPLTHWAGALKNIELPHENMKPTAFIVICQDTKISHNLTKFQKDIGIVAQTITLAAVEQGLGGCMIGNFSADEVKQTLKLEEHIVPMLILALGKPQENIIIKEISSNEDTIYYRDKNDNHYVPKRKLKDIII